MFTMDPKLEPMQDGSVSLSRSSASPKAQAIPSVEKRKGGRKPIYATSEERKQRNRQAQAAFRERRTEYIKQLEIQIKQNEDDLDTLKQNHRITTDACRMLKYKNSLLEKILLERGIDAHAELQSKSDLANEAAARPSSTTSTPTVQRVPVKRYRQGAKAAPGLAPKLKTKTIATNVETSTSISSPTSTFSSSSAMSRYSGTSNPSFSLGTHNLEPSQLRYNGNIMFPVHQVDYNTTQPVSTRSLDLTFASITEYVAQATSGAGQQPRKTSAESPCISNLGPSSDGYDQTTGRPASYQQPPAFDFYLPNYTQHVPNQPIPLASLTYLPQRPEPLLSASSLPAGAAPIHVDKNQPLHCEGCNLGFDSFSLAAESQLASNHAFNATLFG